MRALVVGLALVAAACGQSTAPPAADASAALTSTLSSYPGGFAPVLTGGVTTGEYAPPPIWFICDSIDGPDAFVASIMDEGGAFMLARYHKDTHVVDNISAVRSGELFAAPNGPAQAFLDDGGTQGIIYTLDPTRMSSPDAATTPPVIGIDFAGEEFNCRWFEHMLFLGFTSTESVVVRRVGDSIEMMTFAHDSEGALMVEMQHGEQSTTTDVTAQNGNQSTGYNRDDVVQWGFTSADDGHGYSVWTAESEPSVIQVLTNGEVTRTNEFLAYAIARP